MDARYIGSAESCWHIFEFPMHSQKPAVYRLPVHLEDQQLVYYNPGDNINDVLERAATKETPLTAWFKINHSKPEARNTTYQNFPRTWVYNTRTKSWKARQRGQAIGRMYFASPSSGERFFLRLLLTVVPGATSFAHLRTVNNVPYNTFKEACFVLGLLENDHEWKQCLQEASQMQIGYTLRMLFATIIFHCNPTSPGVLWNQFKHHICDDLLHKLRTIYPNRDFTEDEVYDYGLHLIDHVLRNWGSQLSNIPDMPQIIHDWGVVAEGNRLINDQLDYNRDELAARVTVNTAQFNDAQRKVYDDVMASVNNNSGKTFFLHSAGGCGKIFVATLLQLLFMHHFFSKVEGLLTLLLKSHCI